MRAIARHTTSAGRTSNNRSFFSHKKVQRKPFFKSAIQPQLTISQPGDKHETEADTVAAQVVSQSPQKGKLTKQITPITSSSVSRSAPAQSSGAPNHASAKLAKSVSNQLGKGASIESGVRIEMEHSFGTDFSKVRIHTDSNAHQLNRQLGSNAFATGNDVFFRSGKYAPNTTEGRRLLAHELTHTVQQRQMNHTDQINRMVIQGERIRYRTISWADFEITRSLPQSHDAGVAAGVDTEMGDWVTPPTWEQFGENDYRAIFTFDRSAVELYAYMETSQSWKMSWLVNDEAAHVKFGPGTDIAARRAYILAHEQLHFRNAQTAAAAHAAAVRAAVPNGRYTENFTLSAGENATAKAQQIFDQKMTEVNTAIDTAVEAADAELSKVQGIYDVDTNHSQEEEEQQRWQEHFQEQYEEARDREESEEGAAGHDDHEHDEESG